MLTAKLTITLEASHAVDDLNETLAHHGTPEIINADQGNLFTALWFMKAVKNRGCSLSMDGRGSWRDNIFSSVYGEPRNIGRCICMHTTLFLWHAGRLGDTLTGTMELNPIQA